MKVCIIMSDEEAGYLSKLLRLRYKKGRKIALSTLILLAAKESAAKEAEVIQEVRIYENSHV